MWFKAIVKYKDSSNRKVKLFQVIEANDIRDAIYKLEQKHRNKQDVFVTDIDEMKNEER